MARFTKNTRSKEAFKVLMFDLGCLKLSKDTDNDYRMNLIQGNLRDLFGLTKKEADKIMEEEC